ncbi:MAG: hypothetical protein LBS53_15685, partial [Synergistaceae bacterium]|nr:hypothetical protein [Synergistaceae bacterium]
MKRTTIAGKNTNFAEDLVKRKFDAPAPDKLWVADFTYVPTRTGWCYTAAGYNVSTRMDRNMAASAFKTALHMRACSGREDIANLIHHTYKNPDGHILSTRLYKIKDAEDDRHVWQRGQIVPALEDV